MIIVICLTSAIKDIKEWKEDKISTWKKNGAQLYLGNQETEMQNTVDWQRFYLKNIWVINVQHSAWPL